MTIPTLPQTADEGAIREQQALVARLESEWLAAANQQEWRDRYRALDAAARKLRALEGGAQ